MSLRVSAEEAGLVTERVSGEVGASLGVPSTASVCWSGCAESGGVGGWRQRAEWSAAPAHTQAAAEGMWDAGLGVSGGEESLEVSLCLCTGSRLYEAPFFPADHQES